jgi:hypothetical protein
MGNIFTNKRKYLIASLLLVCIAIAPFNSIPLMIVTICCMALFIQAAYKTVLVFAVLLATLSYSVIGSLIVHIAHLANLVLPFTLIYVLIVLPVAYLLINSDAITKRMPIFGWSDVVHTLLIVFSLLLLLFPLIGASPSKSIEILRLGGPEDTSSQAQMYHYVLSEKTVAYGSKPDGGVAIRESLTSYPQGSHAMAAILLSPIIDESDNYAIVISYGVFLGFLYVMIFYLFFAFSTYYLVKKKDKTKYLFFESSVAVGVLAIGVIGSFLGLFEHSFMGQIASYVGLLFVLGFTLLPIISNKKSKPTLLLSVLMIALGFFLVASSWYLITPLLLPALVFYISNNYQQLKNNIIGITLVLLPFVFVFTYLVYVYLFTTTGSGHILTPGGVDKLSIWSLAILVPSVVLTYTYFRSKKYMQLTITATALLALLLCLAIGAYQYIKIGHLEYYFYKSAYTYILLFAFLFAYELRNYYVTIIEHVKLNTTVVALGVIVFVLLLSGARTESASFARYANYKYTVPEVGRVRLLDLAFKNHDVYKDVMFIGACDKYNNYLATIWAGTTKLGYQQSGRIEGELLTLEGSSLAKAIAQYSNGNKLLVYVIGECDQKAVEALRIHSNITLDETYRSVYP